GRLYFTMKLVEGVTLSTILADPRWCDPEERTARLLRIFDKVCDALAYAHNRGVIHRDLKPANVMVGTHNEVQVMDWGLGKELHEAAQAAPPALPLPGDEPGDPHVLGTQSGQVMGTLRYMPPAQAQGRVKDVDRRSDVFSLGAMLCEILTGHPPYEGESWEEVFAQAERGEVGKALGRLREYGARPGAQPELVKLARRCLKRNRDRRPAAAGVLVGGLAAYWAKAEKAKLEVAKAEASARAEKARAEAEKRLRVRERERVRHGIGVAVLAGVLLLVLVGAGTTLAWGWHQQVVEHEQAV